MVMMKKCKRCGERLVLIQQDGLWVHPPIIQQRTGCILSQQATTWEVAKARKGI